MARVALRGLLEQFALQAAQELRARTSRASQRTRSALQFARPL
jgi:hypothetical protein